jgi:SAM-dependent methyltransferase
MSKPRGREQTSPYGKLPAGEALERLIEIRPDTVLDVGSGAGIHARHMREAGLSVTTLDIAPPADIVTDFRTWRLPREYGAVWASHVLEHQPDPGEFLRHCFGLIREGGWFAVTVPPLKHDIVGGHVTLWNAGLLLYQLILAGFDCAQARVGTYAYNISVIVQKRSRPEVPLVFDTGDIETLAPFFPLPVKHGFCGQIPDVRW